jgi:hypothetical protein
MPARSKGKPEMPRPQLISQCTLWKRDVLPLQLNRLKQQVISFEARRLSLENTPCKPRSASIALPRFIAMRD